MVGGGVFRVPSSGSCTNPPTIPRRCAEYGEPSVYHACGNRACPGSHGRDMRAWLEKREAQLLPCGYFHVVATVPAPIRGAFVADQETMYDLFMKTVAESVTVLCRDERFLGGTPGILMIVHTWTGELHYHPDVHLLVTGSGISDDSGHWRDPKREDFLVPVKAVSKLIRRRFGEALKRLKPDVFDSLPAETWINGWNTFCKGYGEEAEAVLRYLAGYVFRVVLTNARIVNMEDGHVTFRYKDRSTKQWRLCRLDDFTFLDRFLMHVLPKGFHKVRYDGLWHHSKKAQQTARRLLDLIESKPKETPAEVGQLAPKAEALAVQRDPTARGTDFRPKCPRCGCERVIHLEELKRSTAMPRNPGGP